MFGNETVEIIVDGVKYINKDNALFAVVIAGVAGFLIAVLIFQLFFRVIGD